MARPTGVGRALAAYEIPIEGRDEWLAAASGLSHSTVKHHLANARPKVGASNTAQLVWILAPRLPEPEGGAPTDD